MGRERSYSGWTAAVVVAAVLTFAFLYLEPKLASRVETLLDIAKRVGNQLAQDDPGVRLQVDTGIVGITQYPPHHLTALNRSSLQQAEDLSASLVRRPPEPASNAILHEPLTPADFAGLPLTHGSSGIQTLMRRLDQALESPVQSVSLQSAAPQASVELDQIGRTDALQSPADRVGKIPAPLALQNELASLVNLASHSQPKLVNTNTPASPELQAVMEWSQYAQDAILDLTTRVGLEQSESTGLLDKLAEHSKAGSATGEKLQDYDLATKLIRTSYSLQRRVDLWRAIQANLGSTSINMMQARTTPGNKVDLLLAIEAVETYLSKAEDRAGWRKFLLLDELTQWSKSSQENWRTVDQLSKDCLSRINWTRLDGKQRTMLQHESIARLSDLLSTWGREPIDYRQLLTNVEQLEQDSGSRLTSAIADTVHSLRNSKNGSQRQLAETLNTHYRNANLRLTVSQSMLERFLPDAQYEIRPVRQRILGAYTAGDSAVQTQLNVKFQPDPTGWNIILGVQGEMVSSTRSSKGPAVFHNTGSAKVQGIRYLRMDPNGFRVGHEPAQVNSSDQLQKMSTDFDGLPVLGDFARLIVREQFNQKRGLARRITDKIIANETDSEIDLKIAESMKSAEKELNQRILGPLHRLTLDPMIVSMSTTQDRLAIRYRLASESQLAAYTPRPRAPSESLTSFQLHESVLNNAIEKLNLTGREWRLGGLYESLGQVFHAQWTPPEDVPDDIAIRFSDHRPIAIIFDEGKVRLQLRIANFRRDSGLNIDNFTVTSTYVPVAEGLKAGLIRDPEGTIEIAGKNLPLGDRLAARIIFSKVFVSHPELSLISRQWAEDPRAVGLGVSQLEVRDGWIAVAISESDSELATALAKRSKEMKVQLR